MSSTRLPGKVLMPVLGKPLLEHLVERLKRVTLSDDIIVATTKNSADDVIERFCQDQAISCYRGNEEDVLSRYYEAAVTYSADVIVRVTGDCPLLDPALVDEAIRYFIDHHPNYAYVSNVQKRTYPRGMDIEVFSFESLAEAFYDATKPSEREHVTPYLYQYTKHFNTGHLIAESDHSAKRWTVDTKEDYELIRNIFQELYPVNPHFSMIDVLQLLKKRPEWEKINAHIEQKKS
jgi:spore coat polysaccharide biosynthesis protein SpsF